MNVDSKIFTEAVLPCKRVLPSRLVKVAMYEHLSALLGGPPNDYHYTLYSHWSKHNWGMVITGNVQVCNEHLTLGRDMLVPKTLSEANVSPFRKLAAIIHGERSAGTGYRQSLAIMQLNHSGRQSANIIGGRCPFVGPLGPSAVRFGTSKKNGVLSEIFHRLLFQTPRAMKSADIEETIVDFVRGAKLAVQSGFDGVQLHAAHGYLLAQFMSQKANHRTDDYSCESLLLLRQIIKSIREAVPADFVLGIKFNTSDYSISDQSNDKHAQEDRVLAHLREVVSWGGVDFIELSGGDYENPEFMSTSSTSKSSRQAFFAEFSQRAMDALYSSSLSRNSPLILLTGGLRTPAHLHFALAANHAHLVGIGRGAVVCPDLPTVLERRLHSGAVISDDLTPFKPEPDLTLPFAGQWLLSPLCARLPNISLIGAGVGMAWYVVMMRRLAYIGPEDGMYDPDFNLGGLGAVVKMWLWIDVLELQGRGRVVISATCVALLAILYTFLNMLRLP